MDIPANIRHCLCKECSEGGCGLDLSGMVSHVEILSMDCLREVLRPKGRICDCGILWKGERRIAAVELKGGQKSVSVRNLVEQLQGGLNILEGILHGQSVSEFFPILLYSGRKLPASALAGRRVRFRDQYSRIFVKPCGARLASIVPVRNPLASRQRGRRRRRH